MPMTRRTLLAGTTAAAPLVAMQQNATTESAAPRTRGPIRVLAMADFDENEIQQIRNAAPGVTIEFIQARSRPEIEKELANAEVLYGQPTGQILDSAPKLKWVQTGAAGMEWMDNTVRNSPVPLTNMARIFAPGITETAMGLLLCLTRGISTYYMPQFYKHQWKPVGNVRSPDHIELAGKTMGIVGMGGIGSTLARRAHHGFDMRIIATDAKPLAKPEYVAELHDPSWFETMVPQVDVLVSAAPLTPKTRGMFNDAVFKRMKKGSYFLALSRGPLFDDMALVRALKDGPLAGAGLDVFPQEPPPADHPIFSLSNVVMTPHTSGWSPDRQVRLTALFVENLRRYAGGLPLLNVVDKQAGY